MGALQDITRGTDILQGVQTIKIQFYGCDDVITVFELKSILEVWIKWA